MSNVWNKTVTAMAHLLSFMLIIAMALLVLDVVWGVITRAMGEQASWTEELAGFLLIWVSMLGGALAFQFKAHLGVDYFVGKLDAEVAKSLSVLSLVLVLVFAIFIFLIGGGRIVWNAFESQQLTPALGWLKWWVYMAIPLSGFFMLVFTVDQLVTVLRTPGDELRRLKNAAYEEDVTEEAS